MLNSISIQVKQEPASESEDEAAAISNRSEDTGADSEKEEAPTKRTTSRATSRTTSRATSRAASRTTNATETTAKSRQTVEKPAITSIVVATVPTPAPPSEPKKSGPRISDESAYEDAETGPNVILFFHRLLFAVNY